jgi:hypothetical protein
MFFMSACIEAVALSLCFINTKFGSRKTLPVFLFIAALMLFGQAIATEFFSG